MVINGVVIDGWTIVAVVLAVISILIFVYRWGRRDGYYQALREGFSK